MTQVSQTPVTTLVDIPLPDNRWVLDTSTYVEVVRNANSELGWMTDIHESDFTIVGRRLEQWLVKAGEEIAADAEGTTVSNHRLISTSPFAIIKHDRDIPGLEWQVARYHTQGKLRDLPNLLYEKQLVLPAGIPYAANKRDKETTRQRSHWVDTFTAASTCGLTPRELIRDYWRFTDYQRPQIHVIFITEPLRPRMKTNRLLFNTPKGLMIGVDSAYPINIGGGIMIFDPLAPENEELDTLIHRIERDPHTLLVSRVFADIIRDLRTILGSTMCITF